MAAHLRRHTVEAAEFVGFVLLVGLLGVLLIALVVSGLYLMVDGM